MGREEGVSVTKKITFACLVLLVSLTACNVNKDAVQLKPIELNNVSQDVAQFAADHENENGIFLYEKQSSSYYYLYLNESNVEQGNPAYYFDDVSVSFEDNNLIISLLKASTDNSREVTNNELLYELRVNHSDVDRITVYEDGEETYFDNITASAN